MLPRVLLVDDEPVVRGCLTEALRSCSQQVANATDAPRALEAIESGAFDVVVCDLYMPGVSGLELLRLARQSQWDMAFVLMSGKAEMSDLLTAIRLNATDFLLKPFSMDTLVAAVESSFRKLLLSRLDREQQESLGAGIERRTRDLEVAMRNLADTYQATLEAMVAALDAREHETYAHSFRVRAYTSHLARAVGYPAAQLLQLEQAALLHDIGKIAVPDNILLKPARLTEEEFAELKKHPVAGEEILNRIPFLQGASLIVRHHHERYDGRGYPDGLAGDQIPLGARIFTIVDTLDAMTSNRCYRKALGYQAARAEVMRCTGEQFDPRLTDVFFRIPESTWTELGVQADLLSQRSTPKDGASADGLRLTALTA